MFGRKNREKEEREAKALEMLMLEVIKAEEKKEEKIQDLAKTLEEKYADFPIHKLIHLLIKKNLIQLKDLEE